MALAAMLAVGGLACDGGNDENADLAPEIFQDSLRVNPNPAWLNEDASFYFAWKDFDGDMDEPVVTVRFENEDGDERFVEINDVEAEGDTGGSIQFDIEVRDGDEGTYYIIVADEDGVVVIPLQFAEEVLAAVSVRQAEIAASQSVWLAGEVKNVEEIERELRGNGCEFVGAHD
ncbi:MAG: hypothetical protein KC442_12295 [Thermomicrobiales bacterium]|nr:hypothetical protein [Thermomicrobiales bacterium]